MNGGRVINQEVFAAVDVDFLREIINNLIENAIKYTNNGGGIWVNVRGDGDRVLINVTDTGIGISPEDSKHVFQKFYRADNSETRTIGGTGLGLYIVKERVEAMSGSTWVESTFGEGSTFYVAFPRLTYEEYLRRKQIEANTQAMTPQNSVASAPNISAPSVSAPSENQAPAPMQFPTETTTSVPAATPVSTAMNTPIQTEAPMQAPTASTTPVQTAAPTPAQTTTASASPIQAPAPAPTETATSSAPVTLMTPASPVTPVTSTTQSNPFLQNSATPAQNTPASPTTPNAQSVATTLANPAPAQAATINPVSTPITPANPNPTSATPINPAMPTPPITPTNPNILNK